MIYIYKKISTTTIRILTKADKITKTKIEMKTENIQIRDNIFINTIIVYK